MLAKFMLWFFDRQAVAFDREARFYREQAEAQKTSAARIAAQHLETAERFERRAAEERAENREIVSMIYGPASIE